MELVNQALSGNRRAMAQLISQVENDNSLAATTRTTIYAHTGRARVIGVTGAPGTGKSTLVCELAKAYRRAGQMVGIIAVDPTSPFTGGAILGDRIRMRDLAGDPGIFIRSMASRGNLGGLAWATADAVKVLDAAGFDLVFVETVGAGQAEVDIARTAHTTIVVEVPGLGDDVQAIKAGILEIADVFAVNKADHEGADHAVMALRMMLDLDVGQTHTVMHHGRLMEAASARGGADLAPAFWQPPIFKTVATRGEGIAELAEAILAHRAHLEQSGSLTQRERERAAAELETIVQQEALRRALACTDPASLAVLIDQIVHRELDPYTASQRLLNL